MKVTKVIEEQPARKARITDDELRHIVEIFNKAEAMGASGVQAIVDMQGWHTRTVARWLKRAREKGMLSESSWSRGAKGRQSAMRREDPFAPPFEVKWEDPPEAKRGRPVAKPITPEFKYSWYERCMPLKKQPKRWGIIRVYDTRAKHLAAANNLNMGLLKIPPGRWEFCARDVDTEYRVYGRYLGRRR